jgi:phage terminase small subunit
MPTPRKPPEIHVISGAYQNHPNRKPKGVIPKSDLPPGAPPPHFDADQRKVWRELLDMLPASVATKTDRWVMEMACVLMAKFRQPKGLNAAELGKLLNCISLMGATPVDRARLAVPQPQHEANPFGEFAQAS